MSLKATDLQDLSLEFDRVYWHGHYFSAACPFDAHRNKAPLMVYENGAMCFACDQRYSHRQIRQKLSGQTVIHTNDEVVDDIQPTWAMWLERYGSYDGLVDAAYEQTKSFTYCRKPFYSRGLSDATIDKCRLGWLDGWLVFPVISQGGNLVDLVVRSVQEKAYFTRPRFYRNEQTHPFCPDWKLVQLSSKYHVVFGMFDALSLDEIGLPVITGISGKQFSSNLLLDSKVALISPDYNEESSGMRLMQSTNWRVRYRKVNYPDGCKDPNDVLVKCGKTRLREVVT